MNETGASQAPRRGILLMFVAGVLLAFGVFSVLLASRQASDVDVAAARGERMRIDRRVADERSISRER